MKFVLLVEGDTEKKVVADFFKRWLDPQLKEPIGMKVVNFKGNAKLQQEIVKKAREYLESPKSGEIVAVIGLLDLYGLASYPPHATTAAQRHDWAVEDLEKRVGRTKFRMFFAVHELEAWILSQPNILPRDVRDALPKSVKRPEAVDFDEPPAKLLNRLYRSCTGKTYKKTTYGSQLFKNLDPAVAVEQCPYLKAMLAEMLRLARNAVL